MSPSQRGLLLHRVGDLIARDARRLALIPCHTVGDGNILGFHNNLLSREGRLSVLLWMVAIRPISDLRFSRKQSFGWSETKLQLARKRRSLLGGYTLVASIFEAVVPEARNDVKM
jgi:hypothetical protein